MTPGTRTKSTRGLKSKLPMMGEPERMMTERRGIASTIAWAMEAKARGLLDDRGLGLAFGDGRSLLRAIEAIALRQGVGDLLAEGSLRAAQQLGQAAVDLTVTVKGQELPAHMPQHKRSLGLIYAVNAFGADRLGPAMGRLGIAAEPEVTFHPAHEVFLPRAVTLTS